jgi:hypothetical protein
VRSAAIKGHDKREATTHVKGVASPDHLVGLKEQRRRNGEAQGLGGREIDDQLEGHGLLHGEVGRFGTLQNLVHIDGGAPERIGKSRPVGQTSPTMTLLGKSVAQSHWGRRLPPEALSM